MRTPDYSETLLSNPLECTYDQISARLLALRDALQSRSQITRGEKALLDAILKLSFNNETRTHARVREELQKIRADYQPAPPYQKELRDILGDIELIRAGRRGAKGLNNLIIDQLAELRSSRDLGWLQLGADKLNYTLERLIFLFPHMVHSLEITVNPQLLPAPADWENLEYEMRVGQLNLALLLRELNSSSIRIPLPHGASSFVREQQSSSSLRDTHLSVILVEDRGRIKTYFRVEIGDSTVHNPYAYIPLEAVESLKLYEKKEPGPQLHTNHEKRETTLAPHLEPLQNLLDFRGFTRTMGGVFLSIPGAPDRETQAAWRRGLLSSRHPNLELNDNGDDTVSGFLFSQHEPAGLYEIRHLPSSEPDHHALELEIFTKIMRGEATRSQVKFWPETVAADRLTQIPVIPPR